VLDMLALGVFTGMLPADLRAVVADAAGAAAADMLDVAAVVGGSGAQPVQLKSLQSFSCNQGVMHPPYGELMLPDAKCCSCCWLSCATESCPMHTQRPQHLLLVPTTGVRPVSQSPGPLAITSAHLTAALAGAKKRAATAIGAPAIPDVRSGRLQPRVSLNSGHLVSSLQGILPPG
jgi:hypothetical protein